MYNVIYDPCSQKVVYRKWKIISPVTFLIRCWFKPQVKGRSRDRQHSNHSCFALILPTVWFLCADKRADLNNTPGCFRFRTGSLTHW